MFLMKSLKVYKSKYQAQNKASMKKLKIKSLGIEKANSKIYPGSAPIQAYIQSPSFHLSFSTNL